MSSESSASDSRRYSRLGKYDVLSHLASGGMGAVYRAVDVDLGREVALKILAPEFATKPALLERFQREARHIAKLRHRNIVRMYEFGEARGTYFLALEFVDGIDLYEYINRKGQLDPEEARVFLTQAARALDHLHRHQMVHRDIKPSNLLITRENGQLLVKLTDLGLARIVDDGQFRVTRDGSTVGTIDYMSPEQARDSGSADIRSDIYSLGCTWFHMLAGGPPFPDGGLAERLYNHLNTDAPDIRQFNRQVTPRMASMLRRMLAKKPGDRYQTPALLLRELAREDHVASAATPGQEPMAAQERRIATPPKTAASWHNRETPQEVKLAAADASPLPALSPEQRQAAAGQFERAKEVIALGNFDYGIHLLLSCCKLDPPNLTYRRILRRIGKARHKSRGRRFTFLTSSAAKAKLKAAKATHDCLKILEMGEELLVHNPSDAGTHMAMAEAADTLGYFDLAVWLLRHATEKDAPDITVNRALARLYEKVGKFTQAIAVWELVRQADPSDREASRKPRDLAAADTIARGQYEAEAERRQRPEAD